MQAVRDGLPLACGCIYEIQSLHLTCYTCAADRHQGKCEPITFVSMDDINALARLLAVEVLLAEPELLGNDALEADLYILRDKLRKAAGTIISS